MDTKQSLDISSAKLRYLNLGCGQRFSPDWVNVDFVSSSPFVIQSDLRNGVPFENDSFEVVYHSHMLEHLPKQKAVEFLGECFRVLKDGGTLRVAVPDLEQIARLYLHSLERSLDGDEAWQANYEWMKIELYDQTVRNVSGGEFSRYLMKSGLANKEFVLKRMGGQVAPFLESLERGEFDAQETSHSVPNNGLKRLSRAMQNPKKIRDAFLRLLLKDEYRLLEQGRFRDAGEIHLWMYDRYSLANILREIGFRDVGQCTATSSRIPKWSSFFLDANPNESVYKPDSLFMEASK